MRRAFLLVLALVFSTAALADKISISGAEGVKAGEERQLGLRLSADNGTPITLQGLKTVHTKKLHLLVIDDSLTDYQHIHPQPGEEPGAWVFAFTPNTAHNYALWADITPVKGDHEYLGITLQGEQPCSACIETTVSLEGRAGGLKGALTFDGDLKKGEAAMGTLILSDEKGHPAKDLEPVMGAFAHIVGFYAAQPGVVHVHPMSDEPKSEKDRGGPELMFHLEPAHAGIIKLFAQVKRGGKDIFIPFTLKVAP
jgi:hypothetical protein